MLADRLRRRARAWLGVDELEVLMLSLGSSRDRDIGNRLLSQEQLQRRLARLELPAARAKLADLVAKHLPGQAGEGQTYRVRKADGRWEATIDIGGEVPGPDGMAAGVGDTALAAVDALEAEMRDWFGDGGG